MSSLQNDVEEEDAHRRYGAPYTSRHPIPTVQKYKEQRRDLEERQQQTEATQRDGEGESTVKRAYGAGKDAVKAVLTGEDKPSKSHGPYPSANRHDADAPEAQQPTDERREGQPQDGSQQHKQKDDGKKQTAAEAASGETDPRKKRKNIKHAKRDDGGREVTDPVTHLPITIYDATNKDLHSSPENEPAPGSTKRTGTGLSGASKEDTQLNAEQRELQQVHDGMQNLFPPPSFNDTRDELKRTYQIAIIAVVVILISIHLIVVASLKYTAGGLNVFHIGVIVALHAAGLGGYYLLTGWLGKKVDGVWEDEVWDASRRQEDESHKQDTILPESVAWLNSLFASVWPLINPDLFTSIADMLEDVMQASLPKVVRMVSVDDLGQGNEAFRILGIRWLPTGAASRTVDEQGKLKSPKDSQENDRSAPGEGEEEGAGDDDGDGKAGDQNDQAIREGMEAEQGDFVNLELAFAYRARSSGKSLKSKAKNAHLYLRFYLPGGIAVPVWVEMRGIIGKMRLRIQLTPDPPFFSLCTLTFLGQPKADLSCIPLSKHSVNLMDVPLISSFVQSSIDAALSEYVAPKSLTLDLKDMLVGDDFKKDTVSRGVVMIHLKRARGFKEGDGSFGPIKGSSDTYATVSWGKFGKPAASTRIITEDQEPDWEEWSQILVSPDEVNAQENLRIQLWDSDKYTADDDLGRVEVDLKELMHSENYKNKMSDREDRFQGEEAGEEMPGTLYWSVGYFGKSKITKDQLERQKVDKDIKSLEDLEAFASKSAELKLREAGSSRDKEIDQQTIQDFKVKEDQLMIAAPPPDDYPSGILSIQIHNITGLEVQSLNKDDKEEGGVREDQAEQGDGLPSSFAVIILNHQKIYRTRTKPKNSKPFFNAGTERFVRDWKTCEVMISVRDARERENDALLGIVYLPLRHIFEHRTQIMESYPLAGGVGYGRARISMVWRSVQLQLPKELLGWDWGTLEVKSPVMADEVASKLRLNTNLGQGKMKWDGKWVEKHGKENVFLAVRKRYSSSLVLQFQNSSIGPDSTPGFAILWLRDIPDEEERTLKLKIWKGGKKAFKKGTTSCNYQGEQIGDAELTLKFWRGLSTYHKSYAAKSKNEDVKNVMEALDTANDEGQFSDESESEVESHTDDETKKKLKTHANQDSSASEDEDKSNLGPIDKVKEKLTGHNDASDGKRGPMAQIRDYKDHRRHLHRQGRGAMQWKGVRTLDWLATKARHGGSKVEGVFQHSEKGEGVETEA